MENKSRKYSFLVHKQALITKDYLSTLNPQIFRSSDLLKWFRGLCAQLTKLIVFLTDFNKNAEKNTEYKETLLLYLHQLLTILSLQINVFVRETEVDQPLTQIRSFCKKQMLCALDGIEETLSKNSCLEVSNANFINWMDSALEKINEIDFSKKEQAIMVFSEANMFFEEVLSHAMSIAQVILEDDYKKIRGSSQSVLEALASLSNEMNKHSPNTAMLNLFVDLCSNKLCALERKVNTAVLRLSLEVFSDYIQPLQAIHNFCLDKANKDRQEELDNLVVEFDLHVDRILQIGLFAISCSSCTHNCVKIRSCLASLESLETELVPAFTSVLMDSNLNNGQLALLLKEYWITQAKSLRKLIYLIIDPHAFCEVIYEENKHAVEEISVILKDKCRINSNLYKRLVNNSQVLVDFIDVVLEEEPETNVNEIERAFSEVKSILHEVQAAYDVLPQDKVNCLRILKRCKILLTSTKSLYKCFQDENTENKNLTPNVHVEGDKSSVGSVSRPRKSCASNYMDHIVARGQQILKERSILYKTTVGNETFKVPEQVLRSKNDQQPSLKLAHLRHKTFINSNQNSAAELQMTDIMNELNNLTRASLSKI